MKQKILVAMMMLMIASCTTQTSVAETERISITHGKVMKATLSVEIADDDYERAQGLMYRTELADDAGMLFIFAKEDEAAFWMKDTLIPLDMIFINADGTIRSIHHMAEPNSRKIIKSGGKVKAGLEIRGGLAKKMGLVPGDKVHHRVFRKSP